MNFYKTSVCETKIYLIYLLSVIKKKRKEISLNSISIKYGSIKDVELETIIFELKIQEQNIIRKFFYKTKFCETFVCEIRGHYFSKPWTFWSACYSLNRIMNFLLWLIQICLALSEPILCNANKPIYKQSNLSSLRLILVYM